MFNVCPGCGAYDAERIVPEGEAVAICRNCGQRQPFRRLPLYVLTGASGTGKSAVALLLPALLPECVVLDADLLWRPEFATPDDGYRSFRELWLRLAKSIHRIPATAPGKAMRMIRGSSQLWKLTTINRYTSTTAPMMPIASARKELSMLCT